MKSPSKRISIVMTPYNRDAQLRNTLRSIVDQNIDVELVIEYDTRPHDGQWLNPAPILNKALNRASGDVLIIQNGECMHNGEVIRSLMDVPVGEAWFSPVMALHPDGQPDRWYCHPIARPDPFFFCGAINACDMPRFDEDFDSYGYEDKELSDRLAAKGIKFRFLDGPLVSHQWHEPPDWSKTKNMRALYEAKRNNPAPG